MFNVDADDRAAHDRGNVMIGPVSAATEPRMQAVPGRCAHCPISWVGADRDFIGRGPGDRFGAFASFAVATRPASVRAATVLEVGVEDTVITDPDDNVGVRADQGVGERGRVVAGIKTNSGTCSVWPRRPTRSRI